MGECKYCGRHINNKYGYCSRKCEDDYARSNRERQEAYEYEQGKKAQAHAEYLRTTSVNSIRCLKVSMFCLFIVFPIAHESHVWWLLFFPLISIMLGHSGLRQIKQSETHLKGKASAIIGLFISYLVFATILMSIFDPK